MALPQDIAAEYAMLSDEDRAFLELMVGVGDRLLTIAMVVGDETVRGRAARSAREAVIRLTAAAISSG